MVVLVTSVVVMVEICRVLKVKLVENQLDLLELTTLVVELLLVVLDSTTVVVEVPMVEAVAELLMLTTPQMHLVVTAVLVL
jgi:hypothetical protein